MNAPVPTAYSIFVAALEFDSGEQMRQYLQRACGDHRPLRDEIETLLRAHGRAGDFLEEPLIRAVGQTDDRQRSNSVATREREHPPAVSQIGPYHILQEIGEGGFGVVYLAEQLQPIRRRVAVKLIKPGMDSRAVIARFEAERQALALMDDAHIATVLDAGTTAEGYPYFVMELVRGIPITDYCDGMQLDVPARLRLFLDVCSATEHAHQKGIIHRDIKPSNVLITTLAGQPAVKVIDFGIAKAIDQRLTERTLLTQHGQFMGTPQYMSPEQAGLTGGLDIDTRSDVYSLGVLLFELLTGTTPLEVDRIRSVPFDELQRLIREEEAPRPSTRVGATTVNAARARSADAGQLARLLRRELDWIVVKALEKDRRLRYASASELSRDVARFLRHEPVDAVGPSAWYQLRKFVRRHRAAAMSLAAIATVLLLGMLGTSYGLVAARHANKQLSESLDNETMERERAQRVLQFFVKSFALADPYREGAASAKQILDAASVEVTSLLTDDPVSGALVSQAIGSAYNGIGAYNLAAPLLQRAQRVLAEQCGPDHDHSVNVLPDLAQYLLDSGQWSQAAELSREILDKCRDRYGSQHRGTLNALTRIGICDVRLGHLSTGIQSLEEAANGFAALNIAETDEDWLNTLGLLGLSYLEVGRVPEAQTVLRTVTQVRDKHLPAEHPAALIAKEHLASAYVKAGEFASAAEIYESIMPTIRTRLGVTNTNAISMLNNQASCYWKLGRLDEATNLINETIELARSHLGEEHPDLAYATATLSSCLFAARRFEECARVTQEAVELMRKSLGDEHPDTLGTQGNLATLYIELGRMSEGLTLLEDTIRTMERALGDAHPRVVSKRFQLADGYQLAGRIQDALTAYEQAFAPIDRGDLPAIDQNRWKRAEWAGAQLYAGDFAAAESNLKKCLSGETADTNGMSLEEAQYRIDLAAAQLGQGHVLESNDSIDLALPVLEQNDPGFWLAVASNLKGAVLAAQGNTNEAERLLCNSTEKQLANSDKVSRLLRWRIGHCLTRVIEFYEMMGNEDQAKRWRLRRNEWRQDHEPRKEMDNTEQD